MIETVNFRYSFTFAEFRKNYERELAESPYWRKFTIICILVFALGLLLGCILSNLTPWFDQTWSVLGVIPWVIGCLPVVIYYRKTRIDVRKAYQNWTWDGAEMSLGFDLDKFFIQTESTYREYKWKNLPGIFLQAVRQERSIFVAIEESKNRR